MILLLLQLRNFETAPYPWFRTLGTIKLYLTTQYLIISFVPNHSPPKFSRAEFDACPTTLQIFGVTSNPQLSELMDGDMWPKWVAESP